MSPKTRRWEKLRRKRYMRIISLLEESNGDPKGHNRKTRLREVINYARTEIQSTDSNVVTNADQA
jgi:hypothetical protein